MLPNTPIDIGLEVTNKCNLNCKYCFAQPWNKTKPSYKEIKQTITLAKKKINPFRIILGGGEPFTRKDIIQV